MTGCEANVYLKGIEFSHLWYQQLLRQDKYQIKRELKGTLVYFLFVCLFSSLEVCMSLNTIVDWVSGNTEAAALEQFQFKGYFE